MTGINRLLEKTVTGVSLDTEFPMIGSLSEEWNTKGRLAKHLAHRVIHALLASRKMLVAIGELVSPRFLLTRYPPFE